MTDRSPPPIGDNGRPPLDDAAILRTPRYCRFCVHWRPPPEAEERAYEYFRLGLSRRRVRLPTGACDRVLLQPGKPLSFSATSATFGCLNFTPKPDPPTSKGQGFVTIYEGDRLVWQGREADMPAEYREEDGAAHVGGGVKQ